MLTNREIFNLLVTICLVLLILLLQPTLVGGAFPPNKIDNSHCSHKGILNTTDGLCSCYSGYYGMKCNLKFCPFGKSWLSFPIADQQRYQPLTECSNMGVCDQQSGKCTCRPGYVGRACERTQCPSIYTSSLGDTRIGIPDCSGHGRCRTIKEAGAEFNGLSLVLPPVNYTGWDADKLQGCICDPGYDGYDCSFRACPKGLDPQATTSPAYATYTLQCQADSGYFTIFFLGQWTQPIPYNADVAYLKSALQNLNFVSSVTISMQTVAGVSMLCGSSTIFSTSIVLNDRAGPRTPMMVSLLSSNTRMWPDGSTALTYLSGAPTLRMATVYTLTCPVCPGCAGYFYISYGRSISTSLSVSAAPSSIQAAILSLTDFVNQGWPNLVVSVNSASGTICQSGSTTTTTIYIYSSYGNLISLGIVGNKVISYSGSTEYKTLTLTSNNGVGALYECSNQGFCDRKSGVCNCFQAYSSGIVKYKAVSSDGFGNSGSRGDCGYIQTSVTSGGSCYIGGSQICSGHGVCQNSSVACTCFDGWKGLTCQVKDCPSGPAWFDEAISVSEAHQSAECSNMGMCDRSRGICVCALGFSGNACQYRECPQDGTSGKSCSGRGWCKSMRQWANAVGLKYGSTATITAPATAWDADMWFECMCSADTPSGFMGNVDYPTVGPRSIISGYPTTTTNLPGYRNWDCSLRNCPTGDSVSVRNNYGGQHEVQRVVCPLGASASFRLFFMGHWSAPILATANAVAIKAAMEWPPSVGNVTISFPNIYYDGIGTACYSFINYDNGGFLVNFTSNFGNLPLLNPDNPSVEVYEAQQGTKVSLECGGSDMGVCNRDTGLCECYPPYGSSAGSIDVPGNRGDCGYRYPYSMN